MCMSVLPPCMHGYHECAVPWRLEGLGSPETRGTQTVVSCHLWYEPNWNPSQEQQEAL